MKANNFDKRFDNGKNITEFLDLSSASRSGQDQKRINVDLPVWMIKSLDKEAKRLGVTRQSIIKVWLAEKLEKIHDWESLEQLSLLRAIETHWNNKKA